MAQKSGRLKSLLYRNISEILQTEIKNPHIGLISVNEIKVSDDYSMCKVYVSFLGAPHPYKALMELKKSKGFVRSSLAKKMDVYKVPDIDFIYDESFDRADRIDEILKEEEEALNKARKNK